MKPLYVVLGILTTLALVIGIAWADSLRAPANQTSASPQTSSALTAKESFYDFGTISMAAGKVRYAYEVTNTGTEPLILQQLYTSCMCTEAVLKLGEKTVGPFGMPGHGGGRTTLEETLQPSATAMVEAVFDPAAHGPAGVGPIKRDVTLKDSQGGTITLAFNANVKP